MIDIIIPAYRAHKTLFRTLASILQQLIIGDIKVTVVNDCCPEGSYKNIIKHFAPFMNIREIKTPKNLGPGLARQYGIDNSTNPYIIFVDADDVLLDCLVVKTLYDKITEYENIPIIVTGTLEETRTGELIRREPTVA